MAGKEPRECAGYTRGPLDLQQVSRAVESEAFGVWKPILKHLLPFVERGATALAEDQKDRLVDLPREVCCEDPRLNG